MQGNPIQVVMMAEARDFVKTLPQKVRRKIYYNLQRVEGGERDPELFKKLEGSEIWEFRTLFNGMAYRLFAFWDSRRKAIVVATHGLIKKTQKTPAMEISKAERLRTEYLNQE